MKKQLIFLTALSILLGCLPCFSNEKEVSPADPSSAPLNYAVPSNWMYFDNNDDKDHPVDLFYLYPTSASPKSKGIVADVDDHMRFMAKMSYVMGPECMAGFTNVYAPYYRQISAVGIYQTLDADKLEKLCSETIVKEDVFAALDYFFETQNKGKPFILAGHSQGSCYLKIVLSEYMKKHPEYLKRMVACYAIGYYFPESWFKANPHVKKASGETDTGVLITWNSIGPGAKDFGILVKKGGYGINPLNWKTDETPASISANLGSVIVDRQTMKKEFVKGRVSTRLDLKNGSLICEGYTNYAPENLHVIFGDKSLHFYDWSFFYVNIQENAKKRIAAFLKKQD